MKCGGLKTEGWGGGWLYIPFRRQIAVGVVIIDDNES